MSGSKPVPILEMSKLDEFHFGNIPWTFSSQHHLFHINRLEHSRKRLNFPLPPHRKTVHDLIFITKGESTRSKGLNRYSFGPNQFFFLPALQITAHEYMSEDVEGFFLHFSPDLFADTPQILKPFPFLQFNTEPVVAVPPGDVSPILNIFERLLSLYEKKSRLEPKIAAWYLMALFAEVCCFAESKPTASKNAASLLTQQYKSALSQQIYTYNTVREYAQALHVTPNHLNKCVKKTLGKTAQDLLNEMLVLEAKSLLKYSGLTIAQIAERLCRSTPSNFSRFFKRATGVSPKQYTDQ